MTKAKALLEQYLASCFTMQIATVNDGQPWICTVRFVADEQQNLYWASLPSRRHSQEIAQNPLVACAIVVHDVIDEPVIGIQIEGTAAMQTPAEDNRAIVETYAAKFKRDNVWVEDFITQQTKHRLYKLTPSAIYLFDEKHFPGGQRQQIHPSPAE